MRAKPTQLSVIAVAALAIVAVAAVMLLAGGNPAQATTTESLASGSYVAPEQGGPPVGTPTPTPTPTPTLPPHATPEPCTNFPDHVMNSGHLALFEVYWDTNAETLVNNPCPAKLTHIPAQEPSDGNPGTPERHERTATNANIGTTIFHLSSGSKGVLVDANTDTDEAAKQWSVGDYSFLKTGAAVGDPIWVMPECPEGHPPAAGQLCLGFSGGLLHQTYWEGDIQYEFEHETEADDINLVDEGDAFVFIGLDDAPRDERLTWTTTNQDANVLPIAPGEYTHRYWAFTKPGTYRFDVHAKARPSKVLTDQMTRPDAQNLGTLTSEVRQYRIHVGEMADQSVTLGIRAANEEDGTLDPGDDLVIAVQALNEEGPDQASNTKVNVTLPEGLTYKSHEITTYDSQTRAWITLDSAGYDNDTGVWAVGDLAVGKAPLLTITATVAEGTRGQEQVIRANIHATEHIGSSEVVELDPFTANNTVTGTFSVFSIPNTDTQVQVYCVVDRNLAVGADVCPVIILMDSDAVDTLTYALEGTNANRFRFYKSANITGGVGLEVADSNYHHHSSYDLTLTVSDGKDGHSNPDASIDARLRLRIDVHQ